jgi:predicted Mrr-cat superfamily restriction endonuclease
VNHNDGPNHGDLSKLAPDRESFKAKVAETYPRKKAGAISNNAGQLFRFAHEMTVGDFVIYPSKGDRQIHIGRIAGPYKSDLSVDSGYANLRAVDWLKTFPRTRFSQGALYEIGSAMSLFQVKNYSDEFLAALCLALFADALNNLHTGLFADLDDDAGNGVTTPWIPGQDRCPNVERTPC